LGQIRNIYIKIKSLLFSKSMLTVADQIVVSGVNLLIGLTFIYYSNPENYGIYTVYMSLFFLLTNVQNALINTPMMVLTPRLNNHESDNFRKGMFFVLQGFIIFTVFVMNIFSYFEGSFSTLNTQIIALSISSLLLRDFFRAEEFSRFLPNLALKRDFFYFLISILGILVLINYFNISSLSIFIVTGISAFTVSFKKIFRLFSAIPKYEVVRNTVNKSWIHSKWSLLGATSSWAQGNAYIYIPFFLLGTKEIAYIAASRLLMTPIPLLIGSFSNYMRPLLSKNISSGDYKFTVVKNLTLFLITILITYTILIFCLLWLLPESFLPSDYIGLDKFVMLWFAFYLFRIVKSNLSNYMQASLSFKPLAYMGLASTIVTIFTTVISVVLFGLEGSIIGMILGEIFLIVLLIPWLKKNKANRK
jgi:O-antigen/teichoic acid export membrane protein